MKDRHKCYRRGTTLLALLDGLMHKRICEYRLCRIGFTLGFKGIAAIVFLMGSSVPVVLFSLLDDIGSVKAARGVKNSRQSFAQEVLAAARVLSRNRGIQILDQHCSF